MKSMCVLIPYFGKNPPWLNLFLESCLHNSSVNFSLFTNLNRPPDCPSNVDHEKMSLSDFEKLISEKLESRICVEKPFKICDFRPAYGKIFEDYLSGYDWWGYCDVDLVFGNIRHFLTDLILDAHDVITVDHRFMAGHFSLFKNIESTKLLFRRSRSFPSVCSDSKYMGFDEVGPTLTWKKAGPVLDLLSGFESLTHLVVSARNQGCLRPHFGLPIRNDCFLKEPAGGWVAWKNGRLVGQATGEDLFYFHFQKSKKAIGFIKALKNYKNGCQSGFALKKMAFKMFE